MKKSVCFFVIAGLLLQSAAWAGDARRRVSSGAEEVTHTSDVEAEIAFGRELAARILGNYSLYNNKKIATYVNLIGKGLSLYCGRSELKFYFAVLDTDEVNAFAAPGGYVFITKGALFQMENEAQLAGVLGHEIAHIVEKHVVKELKITGKDTSGTSGLASVIGAATGSFRTAFEQALDKASEILTKRGYKTEDEISADRLGVILCYMAGYDPAALARFLEKVKGFEVTDKNYSSDHPQHKVRIQKISAAIIENGFNTLQLATVRERFHEHVKK